MYTTIAVHTHVEAIKWRAMAKGKFLTRSPQCFFPRCIPIAGEIDIMLSGQTQLDSAFVGTAGCAFTAPPNK